MIPVAMLFAALGCLLGFFPLTRIALGIVVTIVTSTATFFLSHQISLDVDIINICWVSLIATSLCVLIPNSIRISQPIDILFCVNAGLWGGLLAGTQAIGSIFFVAIVPLILALPAKLCIKRGFAIIPRVLVSWLLAVTILVGSLPYFVENPGYVPNHRM